MALTITTHPAVEPISLTLVKNHIEYDYDDHDALISDFLTAAREAAEGEQNRCYITQELEYTMDRWPRRPVIYLPRAPVQRVDLIGYIDYAGSAHVYAALEAVTLTLQAGVAEGNDGDVTVILDGTNHVVAVTEGSAAEVAGQIRATPFDGWTTGGSGVAVTFTATAYGPKVDPAYDAGTTGAIGNITRTRQGVDARLIIDTASEPVRISLGYGARWPSITLQPVAAIKIRFTAGYGDSGDAVPLRAKQAIYMLTGHYWENREAVAARGHIPQEMPMGVRALLGFNRLHWSEERNR